MNELDSLVESAQQLFAQAHTPLIWKMRRRSFWASRAR